jgi:hypothetical protein
LRLTPDQVVKARPTACGDCGEELDPKDQRRVSKSQVIELPPVQPVVIELWRYAAVCPSCHHRTVAEAPAGLEPHRVLGPRVGALLGYLDERHHLSYQRLVEVCGELFSLTLSEGAVANALARLAERARPTYEAIAAAVRGSTVQGSDETRARVKGQYRCHWVFQTDQASYHQLATTKVVAVIDDFLAGAKPEVWISDLAPAQLGAPAAAQQNCLAHQLRDLQYAIEADDQVGVWWAVALQRVFRRGIQLHRTRDQVTPTSFARRRTLIEQRPGVRRHHHGRHARRESTDGLAPRHPAVIKAGAPGSTSASAVGSTAAARRTARSESQTSTRWPSSLNTSTRSSRRRGSPSRRKTVLTRSGHSSGAMGSRSLAAPSSGSWANSDRGVRCIEERGVLSHKVTNAGRRSAGDRFDIVREAIIPIGGMELGHGQHML